MREHPEPTPDTDDVHAQNRARYAYEQKIARVAWWIVVPGFMALVVYGLLANLFGWDW